MDCKLLPVKDDTEYSRIISDRLQNALDELDGVESVAVMALSQGMVYCAKDASLFDMVEMMESIFDNLIETHGADMVADTVRRVRIGDADCD